MPRHRSDVLPTRAAVHVVSAGGPEKAPSGVAELADDVTSFRVAPHITSLVS